MANIGLKFFTVVNSNGLPFFSIHLDSNLDAHLFSGFLSAIFSFGTQSLNDQLGKLSVEGKNAKMISYIFENSSKIGNIIVLAMIDHSIDVLQFQKFAKLTVQQFLDKFRVILENWNGDISIFESFKEQIEQEIKNTFQSSELTYEVGLDLAFEKLMQGDLSGIDHFCIENKKD
jgi:hypothetical protein